VIWNYSSTTELSRNYTANKTPEFGHLTIFRTVKLHFSTAMILKNATPIQASALKDNPRLAMLQLTDNRLVQAFFDWLTGYYLTPPLWKSAPSLELIYGTLQYTGGLAIALTHWQLIPLGCWLSVAGAAQLQEVAHFCAHNAFFPQYLTYNHLLGCLLTLLTGKKPFPLFKEDHLLIHHPPKNLATMNDKGNTPYLVEELGFEFAEELDFYWQNLGKVLISPQFYGKTCLSRLTNLLKAPVYYQLATLVLLLLACMFVWLTHSWVICLLWFLFTQLGTYAAALLQQLPEHNWAYEAEEHEGAKSQVIGKSFALYLGAYPPLSSNWLEWLKWYAALVGAVFIRLTVLPVNLGAHCVHHATPNDRNWANQLVTLRAFQDGSVKGWERYRFSEVWGYLNALNYVFVGFSLRRKS
jgi:fatty acid desaturase